MIHGIHAGDKRKNPLVIVGFRGTTTDFSQVRFPAELSNCLKCHVETKGIGSFELPLASTVLGSTIATGGRLGSQSPPYGYVDLDPSNDVKITPTAAACSGCHDDRETIQHMITTGGASFNSRFVCGKWQNTERCATCHGPGKKKGVRKVHEIGEEESEH